MLVVRTLASSNSSRVCVFVFVFALAFVVCLFVGTPYHGTCSVQRHKDCETGVLRSGAGLRGVGIEGHREAPVGGTRTPKVVRPSAAPSRSFVLLPLE